MKKRVSPGGRRLALAIGGSGVLLFAAILALASHPTTVVASSGDLNSAVSKYPNINGSRIDTCTLCHTSSIPALNAYGTAYKNAGRNSAAFAAIEAADSDRDGFTNVQEINALTFPGDAGDHPAAAPTATATRVPPTATQVPPTATPIPPTATRVPPTATSVPPTATQVPATATPTRTATVLPTNTSLPPTATRSATSTAVPPTVGATSIPTATPTSTLAPSQTPTSPAPSPTATAGAPNPPTPTTAPVTGNKTYRPAADAYVNRSRPNTNYGSERVLRVDRNPSLRSYLRFTVSDLGGAAIQKAVLRVYVNSDTEGAFEVHAVSSNQWSESQITSRNAPPVGTLIRRSGEIEGSGWISVDVSAYVKNEGTYSLVLTGRDGRQINLASREAGDHAPQLVVTSGTSSR